MHFTLKLSAAQSPPHALHYACGIAGIRWEQRMNAFSDGKNVHMDVSGMELHLKAKDVQTCTWVFPARGPDGPPITRSRLYYPPAVPQQNTYAPKVRSPLSNEMQVDEGADEDKDCVPMQILLSLPRQSGEKLATPSSPRYPSNLTRISAERPNNRSRRAAISLRTV